MARVIQMEQQLRGSQIPQDQRKKAQGAKMKTKSKKKGNPRHA